MWWCGSDIPPTVVRQYSDSAPTVRQSDSPTVVRQSDSVRQWQHTFTVILVRQSTTVVRQWSDRGPTVRQSDSPTELRQCPTELRQCPTAPTVLTARAQPPCRSATAPAGLVCVACGCARAEPALGAPTAQLTRSVEQCTCVAAPSVPSSPTVSPHVHASGLRTTMVHALACALHGHAVRNGHAHTSV
jgi:hypothetical protein